MNSCLETITYIIARSSTQFPIVVAEGEDKDMLSIVIQAAQYLDDSLISCGRVYLANAMHSSI